MHRIQEATVTSPSSCLRSGCWAPSPCYQRGCRKQLGLQQGTGQDRYPDSLRLTAELQIGKWGKGSWAENPGTLSVLCLLPLGSSDHCAVSEGQNQAQKSPRNVPCGQHTLNSMPPFQLPTSLTPSFKSSKNIILKGKITSGLPPPEKKERLKLLGKEGWRVGWSWESGQRLKKRDSISNWCPVIFFHPTWPLVHFGFQLEERPGVRESGALVQWGD